MEVCDFLSLLLFFTMVFLLKVRFYLVDVVINVFLERMLKVARNFFLKKNKIF